MTRTGFIRRTAVPLAEHGVRPAFETGEEAWLWAAARLEEAIDSRAAGTVRRGSCEPRDIAAAVARLGRQRSLSRPEIAVLCRFGSLRRPPDRRDPSEWDSARLWDRAIGEIDRVLKAKGLVAGNDGRARDGGVHG